MLIPTPTPTPIIRSELKIEVQNGSGVVGLQGKGKKYWKRLDIKASQQQMRTIMIIQA